VAHEFLGLVDVTDKTRWMPDEFIAASGTDVTDALRLYLRPLLGKGMPDVYPFNVNANLEIGDSILRLGLPPPNIIRCYARLNFW
jgi:hypothetical protein